MAICLLMSVAVLTAAGPSIYVMSHCVSYCGCDRILNVNICYLSKLLFYHKAKQYTRINHTKLKTQFILGPIQNASM